jgi:hypothetical protein
MNKQPSAKELCDRCDLSFDKEDIEEAIHFGHHANFWDCLQSAKRKLSEQQKQHQQELKDQKAKILRKIDGCISRLGFDYSKYLVIKEQLKKAEKIE